MEVNRAPIQEHALQNLDGNGRNLHNDGAGQANFRNALDIQRAPGGENAGRAQDGSPAREIGARPIRDDDTAASIWHDFMASKHADINHKLTQLSSEDHYIDAQHKDADKLASAMRKTQGGSHRPHDLEAGEGHPHAAESKSYLSALGGWGTRFVQGMKHTNRHAANMRNVDELHKRAMDLHGEIMHGPESGFLRMDDQLNEGRNKIASAEGKVGEKQRKVDLARAAVGHREGEERLALNGVQRASNKILREMEGSGEDHGSEKVDNLMEGMDKARKDLVVAGREADKARQELGGAEGELSEARAGVSKERAAFRSSGYDVQDGARKKLEEFSKAFESWNDAISKTKTADKSAPVNDLGKMVNNLPSSLAAGAVGAEMRLGLQAAKTGGGHSG